MRGTVLETELGRRSTHRIAANALRPALMLAALLGMPLSLAAQTPAVVPVAQRQDESHSFTPKTVETEGTITLRGGAVRYRAVAGTLVVHAEGWDPNAPGSEESPEASMSYVAYLGKGSVPASRPVLFIYGGGPGGSAMGLHMDTFGPKRLVIPEAPARALAPYRLVDNTHSLLDTTDLVFIDAPGTGYGKIRGKNKEKAFYGLDADAQAFGQFITSFLSRFDRWSSPKYIMGQSYGTARSAVLARQLQTRFNLDLNGVILLSQCLNFNLGSGGPAYNPGTDSPYITLLPTFAAVAWYHDRLPKPRPQDFAQFIREVEQFANTDYTLGLQAGSSLDPSRRAAIAARMSQLIGIPADYILTSDLRMDVGQFRQTLLKEQGLVVGEVDGRYTGHATDLLAKEADYDPERRAVGPANYAAFMQYMKNVLGYREETPYRSYVDLMLSWTWDRVQPPGAPTRIFGIVNVLPDLATAMKSNPHMKVLVLGGYYDLTTQYSQSRYEMQHLQIPADLNKNIEYQYYPSGHSSYIHEPSLERMRSDLADFIRRSDNVNP